MTAIVLKRVSRGLAAAALAGGLAFAAPVLAQETIRVGTATTSVIVAPLLLLEAEPEILAARGLKMTFTNFQGRSVNCIAALISDSVDVCIVGTTTGTDAIAEGADLKALGAFALPINEIVLSKSTVDKLGVKPDAPARDRLLALKGLRIISAAPGSAHYLTLEKSLQSVGLAMSDLKYQVMGDTVAMMQAIKNDRVDGALWSAGSLGGLIAEGAGVRWISVANGDLPFLNTLPYTSIYTKSPWLNANRDKAMKFQAAVGDAIRLTRTRADVSDKVKAKFFPDLDKVIWDDGFAQAKAAFFEGARIPKDGWGLFLEMQTKSTGKNYAPAAFEKVVVNAP